MKIKKRFFLVGGLGLFLILIITLCLVLRYSNKCMTGHAGGIQGGSGPLSALPEAVAKDVTQAVPHSQQEGGRPEADQERFDKALLALELNQTNNSSTGSVDLAGMLSRAEAKALAFSSCGLEQNANRRSTVSLIGDVYIVEIDRPENIFRNTQQRHYIVGLDALTGSVLSKGMNEKGMQFYWTDKDTRESPEKSQRVQRAILELDERASTGEELNSTLVEGMISPEIALSVAEKQVTFREGVLPPLAVLVDDVYMVVFWRPDGKFARYHKKKYYERVVVDAYTGEYVGMETTKEP